LPELVPLELPMGALYQVLVFWTEKSPHTTASSLAELIT
jgi:hypothetical protein